MQIKISQFVRRFVVGLVVVGGLSSMGQRGAADDLIERAPQGLAIDTVLQPATFPNNDAVVTTKAGTEASPQQVVMLVNGANKVGALWSTPGNGLDLTRDQHLSFKVYLGASENWRTEGVAFVLHGDPRGQAAITTGAPGDLWGETLGVYGTDRKKANAQQIAQRAIQHSWALELDTNHNESGVGSGFDRNDNVDGQHVAVSYPGLAETYHEAYEGFWPLRSYFYKMNHQQARENLHLTNKQWHPVDLQWQATTQTMTYTIDGHVQRTTIDLNKLGGDRTNVTWGLTSTTSNQEHVTNRSLVVFDRLPGTITGQVAVDVHNVTQDIPVTAGAQVRHGDELAYRYRISHVGGAKLWQHVLAQLNWARQLNVKSIIVQYADGHTEPLKLPAAGVNQLAYQLTRALSADNPSATIIIQGTVAAEDDVTSQHAEVAVTSSSGQATSTIPDFTMIAERRLALTVPEAELTADKGQIVTVAGQLTVNDKTTFDPRTMTSLAKVNGQTIRQPLTTTDPVGTVRLRVTPQHLHVGENQLELWVRDAAGNESPRVTVKITVRGGELKIKHHDATKGFEPLKLTGSTQLSRPRDGWQLVVSDERGRGRQWQLSVSATPFQDAQGRLLAGELVYQNGQQQVPVNHVPVAVAQRTSTSDDDVHNALGGWSSDQGLFIKTRPDAISGDYVATLTWRLTDAPQ